MRSTIVACTLLAISSDAFKVCPVLTRRGLMAKAAAASVALSPLAALAELKKASDADVYARANGGQLTPERVVERLKKGELVDGSSASCGELERLIATDRQAILFEQSKLEVLRLDQSKGARDQERVVKDIEKMIKNQVAKLEGLKEGKECLPDEAIYKRADEGKLNAARVIERAKEGTLVRGEGATCKQLDALLQIDRDSIEFEKDKLEALEYYAGKDGEIQKKIVAEAESAIQKQLDRLEGFKKTCQ